ncbi:YiiD C-terminal domain-containing protein [Pleionea sediminis]|uniref:YiiD C-terminal domain-containing protein n=1 Tax=Pleionea sediminis TaxID=2569479 RepID=UPI001184B4A2|nr:YiiD C-terminal domain-containing protein [Pleionea sediminis]
MGLKFHGLFDLLTFESSVLILKELKYRIIVKSKSVIMLAKDYWTQKIHTEIPATKLLNIQIDSLDPDAISVSAPYELNCNGHQTGFAGSIYTLGITTGWTLISNRLKEEGIEATVVAGQADIKYKEPLRGDLIAHTSFPESHPNEKWQIKWKAGRSSRQRLRIGIGNGNIEAAEINATFYIKKL